MLEIDTIKNFPKVWELRDVLRGEPPLHIDLGDDRDLFAGATKVNIGNGMKAKFWEDAWLHGSRPKDVAPLIYEISKKKMCLVAKALDGKPDSQPFR